MLRHLTVWPCISSIAAGLLIYRPSPHRLTMPGVFKGQLFTLYARHGGLPNRQNYSYDLVRRDAEQFADREARFSRRKAPSSHTLA